MLDKYISSYFPNCTISKQSNSDPSNTLNRWFSPDEKNARKVCKDWLNSTDPKGYYNAYKVFSNEDGPSENDLDKLHCPSLFITGSREPNSTPEMTKNIDYLIENLDRTIEDPFGMIFSGSGLVFLGGLIGSTLCVSIILEKRKLSWPVFADIIAPLIMVGYSIGRIGCFLVGDDYGLPSSLPWAISFPEGIPPTTISSFSVYYPWIDTSNIGSEIIKVHPTQLYINKSDSIDDVDTMGL